MATKNGEKLSKASPYEQTFGVRHRGSGRPVRSDGADDVIFPREEGLSPILQRVALRRAYAVVHEENRDRLSEVYAAELKVLKRRGEEIVARDAGIRLDEEG